MILLTGICLLLWLFLLLIFARVITSWFPVSSTSRFNEVLYQLYRITEPPMSMFRRVVPPIRFGGMALDLSAMILTFIIFLLLRIVC